MQYILIYYMNVFTFRYCNLMCVYMLYITPSYSLHNCFMLVWSNQGLPSSDKKKCIFTRFTGRVLRMLTPFDFKKCSNFFSHRYMVEILPIQCKIHSIIKNIFNFLRQSSSVVHPAKILSHMSFLFKATCNLLLIFGVKHSKNALFIYLVIAIVSFCREIVPDF